MGSSLAMGISNVSQRRRHYAYAADAFAADHSGTGVLTVSWDYVTTDDVELSHGEATKTGTTTPGNATNAPNADGHFYDAAGNQFRLRAYNGAVSIAQFGANPAASTAVQAAAMNAAEAHCFAYRDNCYIPPGTHDYGAGNLPWRSATTAQKDYGGITIFGSGPECVLKTSSLTGADVLQFQAVKGLSVRNFGITAVTPTSNAGTNGISITSGGEDITISDMYFFNLVGLPDTNVHPITGVDGADFLNGGKAVTIQASTTNDLRNVNIRNCRAYNCGFGFGMDAPFTAFHVDTDAGYIGVNVDNCVADNCWTACAISAAAPTGSGVPLVTDIDTQLRVRMTALNCAKGLVSSRWMRGDIKLHIQNTVTKASLYRPLADDQEVIAATVLGDFWSKIRITGRMHHLDHKLRIGGSNMGSSGLYGYCRTSLYMDIEAPALNTGVEGLEDTEIDLVNIGGNTTGQCNLALVNFDLTNAADIASFNTIMEKPTNTVRLGAADHMRGVVKGSGATRTLTKEESGAAVLFDRAGGLAVTLPPPLIGLKYKFLVTLASQANSVTTDAGTTFVVGVVSQLIDTSGTMAGQVADGTTHTTLSIDDTGTATKGGKVGTWFTLECVTATKWQVTGQLVGEGALVTPFS